MAGKALAALLALGALLAGCAGSEEAARPMHIAARIDGEMVRLAVENIPPGREITALVLVDPAGGETPARERELVTRETGSGGNAGPGVGIGASGGSSSGIRPHISLGYLFRADDTIRRSQRMTAEIPLPDPAAYAAGWRDWRIELRYRDQLGEPQRAGIPAPPP
ncbi:MAG: hypothetical protein ACFCUW_16715 [Kiloniellaceae bacterium]